MELVFSINYRVLSTINFSSTKDHGRFVGDEVACARLSDSIRSGNVLKAKLRRARLFRISYY